jgi:hypothetical protein
MSNNDDNTTKVLEYLRKQPADATMLVTVYERGVHVSRPMYWSDYVHGAAAERLTLAQNGRKAMRVRDIMAALETDDEPETDSGPRWFKVTMLAPELVNANFFNRYWGYLCAKVNGGYIVANPRANIAEALDEADARRALRTVRENGRVVYAQNGDCADATFAAELAGLL